VTVEIPNAERRIVHAQHLLRRAIGELHASVAIDHDDAFHHAGEDGRGARALARQLLYARGGLTHGAFVRRGLPVTCVEATPRAAERDGRPRGEHGKRNDENRHRRAEYSTRV